MGRGELGGEVAYRLEVGEIEPSGKIWERGVSVGSIEASGKLWLRGSQVGEIEDDGDIWIGGSQWGEAEGYGGTPMDRAAVVAYLIFVAKVF